MPIPAGAENTSSETNMIEVFSFADKALNSSHFFFILKLLMNLKITWTTHFILSPTVQLSLEFSTCIEVIAEFEIVIRTQSSFQNNVNVMNTFALVEGSSELNY